jgi:hypothetical protein
MRAAVQGTVFIALAGLTSGACRTTHDLGSFDDRAIRLEAARIDLSPKAPGTEVPGTQLTSFSTYDRLRGARDGALIVGIPAFVVGAAAGGWLAAHTTGCGCGEGYPSVLQWGLVFGAVSGIAGAVVGGGVGALLTHEDRYMLASRR